MTTTVKRKHIHVSEYVCDKDYSFEKPNELPSETIPSQAYTIRDLLEMHKRGLTPSISKTPIYEEEDFGEEMNPVRKQNLDLTDIDEIKASIDKSMEVIDQVQKKRKKVAENAKKEQIIKEYEASKEKDSNKNVLP